MPAGWEGFRLPEGVNDRSQTLLDRQDNGYTLTSAERKEAEGLIEIAEWLSFSLAIASNCDAHRAKFMSEIPAKIQ